MNETETPTSTPAPHLFPFTDREEAWIERAKDGAAKFMDTFGKGSKPQPIDLRYYSRGVTTPDTSRAK